MCVCVCVRLCSPQPHDRSVFVIASVCVCVRESATCSMPISCWIRSHMYDYILKQISKDTLRQVKLRKFSVALLLFSFFFFSIFSMFNQLSLRCVPKILFVWKFHWIFCILFELHSVWNSVYDQPYIAFAFLRCDSVCTRQKKFHVLLKIRKEITHSRMPNWVHTKNLPISLNWYRFS